MAEFMSRQLATPIEDLAVDDRDFFICASKYLKQRGDLPAEWPVRLEDCGHVFGNLCLERWLSENDSCPGCRRQLFERTMTDSSQRAESPLEPIWGEIPHSPIESEFESMEQEQAEFEVMRSQTFDELMGSELTGQDDGNGLPDARTYRFRMASARRLGALEDVKLTETSKVKRGMPRYIRCLAFCHLFLTFRQRLLREACLGGNTVGYFS